MKTEAGGAAPVVEHVPRFGVILKSTQEASTFVWRRNRTAYRQASAVLGDNLIKPVPDDGGKECDNTCQ
jgi:hypothetical protein